VHCASFSNPQTLYLDTNTKLGGRIPRELSSLVKATGEIKRCCFFSFVCALSLLSNYSLAQRRDSFVPEQFNWAASVGAGNVGRAFVLVHW
jgi:hypothetical protein